MVLWKCDWVVVRVGWRDQRYRRRWRCWRCGKAEDTQDAEMQEMLKMLEILKMLKMLMMSLSHGESHHLYTYRQESTDLLGLYNNPHLALLV